MKDKESVWVQVEKRFCCLDTDEKLRVFLCLLGRIVTDMFVDRRAEREFAVGLMGYMDAIEAERPPPDKPDTGDPR